MNPSKGVIPPEDEMLITVTYSPTSVGTFSRDHYEVVTVGGNKVCGVRRKLAFRESARLGNKTYMPETPNKMTATMLQHGSTVQIKL